MRHAFNRTAEYRAAANRRRNADQTKSRGGWSGGGWTRLWSQELSFGRAIRLETAGNRSKVDAGTAAKLAVMQTAMTGFDSGASARPAIKTVATSRRMVR